MERSEVPDCESCTAWEENPAEFVESDICPVCVWQQDIQEPIIFKLLDFLAMLDADCPVGRHELTNNEWLALGVIKTERDRLSAEKARRNRPPDNAPPPCIPP